MRFALIAVVSLALVGCFGEGAQPLPTAPDPPAETSADPADPIPEPPPPRPGALAFVVVVVTEEGGSGACIRGATVEIVRGQGLGRRVAQADWCSYWDPDFSASFNELNPGEELTLRASASGYAARERTVVPTLGLQRAVAFELPRIPR